MRMLAIAVVISVIAVSSSTEQEVLEHKAVLAWRNGVRLLMYQGGYPMGLLTKDDFRKYLQTYVDFVKEKHIDKVMLSIQDPEALTILKNEDVIVEFMRSLPSYVELGALLEIDARYPWGYDVSVPGGFNPFSKVVYGGSPPDPDRQAIINRILSPGPDHCKPRNINESELFCPGNYKIDPRWKATCSGDPCGLVSKGSYCKGPLECHGFLPLPPTGAVESSFAASSSNTCPTTSPPPPGCPNNIPKAIAFLSSLNRKAQVPGNPNGARMFTFVGYDTEDGGGYGPSALVTFFVQMVGNFTHDYLETIPDGYSITSAGLGPAQNRDDKAKMIFFGDAGVDTKNPVGEQAGIDCKNFIPADDKASLFLCGLVVASILPHIETYPELYWFVDQIQQSGCIGCKHAQAQMFTESSNYWNRQQISSVNQCSQCFQYESCKKYVKYFTDYTSSTYPQCITEPECGLCCECLACLPCAFDANGQMFGPQNPNSRLVYQKYRNDPSNLINSLASHITSDVARLLATPNNWPMFSIETAHNWMVTEGGYKYDAAFGPKTCLGRSFNGDTCGTFDGLGNWEWEKFVEMATGFAAKYGLKNIGIYEIQFLPPHWFNNGRFTHPGPDSAPMEYGGAPRDCPTEDIISKINANAHTVTDPQYVIDTYLKAEFLYHGHRYAYTVCPGLTIGDPCGHVNPASWLNQNSGVCRPV